MRIRRGIVLAIVVVGVVASAIALCLHRKGIHGRQTGERPSERQAPGVTVPDGLVADTFEYPFLGKVSAFTRNERIPITNLARLQEAVDVKVFYNKEGVFLRAEYARAGSEDWELSPALAERNYKSVRDRIVGMPTTPVHVSLQQLLENIRKATGARLELATKWNITRAVLASLEFEEPREVFIVNVFGADRISDRLPDEAATRRIRYLVDVDGEVITWDNVL